MTFNWMSKWKIGFDSIVVPSSQMFSLDVSRLFQISYDPLDGTFCDAYHQGRVPHLNLGLTGDTKQNMGVVGKKCPKRFRLAPGSDGFCLSRRIGFWF
jgi:hypothetical protein